MTVNLSRATIAMLIYTINSLADLDPQRSSSEIDDHVSSGVFDFVIARASGFGLDTSYLEQWRSQNSDAATEIDEIYIRWTNASGVGNYMLPSQNANGWIWLSSISTDIFFISQDSGVRVE